MQWIVRYRRGKGMKWWQISYNWQSTLALWRLFTILQIERRNVRKLIRLSRVHAVIICLCFANYSSLHWWCRPQLAMKHLPSNTTPQPILNEWLHQPVCMSDTANKFCSIGLNRAVTVTVIYSIYNVYMWVSAALAHWPIERYTCRVCYLGQVMITWICAVYAFRVRVWGGAMQAPYSCHWDTNAGDKRWTNQ